MSAASGAVGSLVGQLAANIAGCTVIGSCGGPNKVAAVRALGFDHVIDYKRNPSVESLSNAIRHVAPDGIDMDFEVSDLLYCSLAKILQNVGGIHFDAAFNLLRTGGRIAVCGAISHLTVASASNMVNIGNMISSSQRIQGFVATTYLKRGDWLAKMATWLREEKIKAYFSVDISFCPHTSLQVVESVYHGINDWPKAFMDTLSGSHLGKTAVMTV